MVTATSACVDGKVTDSAGLPVSKVAVCLESLDEVGTQINRCVRTDLSGDYRLRIDDLFSTPASGLYRLFAYKSGFKDALYPEPIQIPDHGGIHHIDLQLRDTDMAYHFELLWYDYSCFAGPCGYYWETEEGHVNMGEEDMALTACITKYVDADGEVTRIQEDEMYVVIESGIGMIATSLCFSEESLEGTTIQKTYRIEEPSGGSFQESESITFWCGKAARDQGSVPIRFHPDRGRRGSRPSRTLGVASVTGPGRH